MERSLTRCTAELLLLRVSRPSTVRTERTRTATTELMNWTAVGSVLLVVAVAAGAFGAHGLRSRLDAYSLSVDKKTVFSHCVHALDILSIAILAHTSAISTTGANRTAGLLLLRI